MISVEQIRQIVEQNIAGSEKFIVDVSVKSGNRIEVELDSPWGIRISDCTEMHRFIENSFDRNVEDFELTVSSPGLEEPFKILKQFRKNLGRNVRVILKTGIVAEGKLTGADEKGIEISQKVKKKNNGKKQISVKLVTFASDQIKSTCLMLNIGKKQNEV